VMAVVGVAVVANPILTAAAAIISTVVGSDATAPAAAIAEVLCNAIEIVVHCCKQ